MTLCRMCRNVAIYGSRVEKEEEEEEECFKMYNSQTGKVKRWCKLSEQCFFLGNGYKTKKKERIKERIEENPI
ncbi:hypothetical protein BLOT_012395 [Blomia tropicalis]|nr:hypothetical protein BLOT_012395 [Blomia tropicalis]